MTSAFNIPFEAIEIKINLLELTKTLNPKDVLVIDYKEQEILQVDELNNDLYLLLKSPLTNKEQKQWSETGPILRSYPGSPEEILEMIGEL